MKFELVTLAILGFAAFRITRFLVIDTLIDGLRAKFHTFLANRRGKLQFLAQKALELTSCTWCAGFWVSLLLYSLYVWHNPLDFTRFDWINTAAVAGVQGLLHAYEPEE